jgi:hypothetical protein
MRPLRVSNWGMMNAHTSPFVERVLGQTGATHRYRRKHDVRPGSNLAPTGSHGNFYARRLSLPRPATRRGPIAEY